MMIFDRTSEDVKKAKQIREEKVMTFQELTAEEAEIMERGTITINTLNRIEDKQAELKSLINNMGYWNTPTINKNWKYTQIFDEAEFQRIVNNTNILREAFFVYVDTPKTPSVSYRYNDINALEKILVDIEKMIDDVKSYYRECGNIVCGEQ